MVDGIDPKVIGAYSNNSSSKKEVNDKAQGQKPNTIFVAAKDIIAYGGKGYLECSFNGESSFTVQVPSYTNGILEGTVDQTVPYQGDVKLAGTASHTVSNNNNSDYSDITNAAIEGGVNGAINDISSKSEETKGIDSDKDAVEQFKKMDTDGDLKVSAQEYTDNIVNDYVKNGNQLPTKYSNVAEFINDKYKEFKQYAGADVSMNIDEFRNMIIGRLTQGIEKPSGDIPEMTKENNPIKE